jgi:hypothetical protein
VYLLFFVLKPLVRGRKKKSEEWKEKQLEKPPTIWGRNSPNGGGAFLIVPSHAGGLGNWE